MKLTKSEAETLLSILDLEIRRKVSKKLSTKRLDKIRDKLSHYLTLKGHPSK